MNYYEVLPLKKTGPESRTFTYQSELKLPLGIMVLVPLKNRTVRGLVMEQSYNPDYKTKEVLKVLSDDEILTKSQIIIAKKISEYYICSLGETINAFLPFDFGKNRHTSPTSNLSPITSKKSSIKPNSSQTDIIKKITDAKASTTHLIYGVTGSGKTEIYLRLVAKALKKGKGCIILVPEIALTPQTFNRFYERFGDKVAVWHSDLKETEKYRTWNEIKSGAKQVVLGARSAVLMPVKNLQYVIIDEEHESSYKQDQTPRYDARKVAEWLGEATGAKVILGSATPRVESFYKAKNNEYFLYSLSKRIIQESMPPVSIVDLRDEFRKGNKSIISDELQGAIAETLNAKKQVMLLLNRRGAATFVNCRDCGYVEVCPNCDIPLTYHPSEGQVLKCHHCDYRKTTPVICPECQSTAIRFFGLGTQRAEIEISKLFPEARIVRMDRDTTGKRGSHEDIFHDFKNEKFDIIIGTQMIAKGWDLPNVELVGVISADTMINLPDFRSAERTFSLLTQVAGRTGRGFHPGKVILQTYTPDNYAVISAAKHDYFAFYEQEIKSRQKYGYPPFSMLIKMVYAHQDAAKAEKEAKAMSEALTGSLKSTGVVILGPSPSFIEKLAGKYRYQLVLKIPDESSQSLDLIKNIIKSGWSVDIDPENLL